jgi:DNA-binding LytR/AlgR family response regulator
MIKLINTNNHHFFHFIETRQDILSKLNFGKLIFIYFKEDSLNTRLELRRLLTKNNALNVVLVSEDIALSKLAWKTNVLHFINPSNQLNKQYENLCDKLYFINTLTKLPKKIKLNYLGGADIIDIEDILYCRAEGNYSTLYLKNMKKKTYTIQISKLMDLLNKYSNISRIGKSVLINFKNITQIKKDEIIFMVNEKQITLKLSSLLVNRIKKEIIWY